MWRYIKNHTHTHEFVSSQVFTATVRKQLNVQQQQQQQVASKGSVSIANIVKQQ